MISTCSLQSGSNGNCIYVETNDARLLFDAGISSLSAQRRLAQYERNIREVDAVIISHNHSDHLRHAGVFHRKFSMPVYITNGAWQAGRSMLGIVKETCFFEPGQILQFGETTVETVPTPHDGVECVAFVITSQNTSLGIFTDLGHCFEGIDKWLSKLDGLYLESNYDPEMLSNGPYPVWLKQRIQGLGGHISNGEAAQLVSESASGLKLLILSHLSEHNNRPELALATAREILGSSMPIALAERTGASEMFTIG